MSTGMKFNKTYDETLSLHFISTARIRQIASQAGFRLEVIASKSYSSNTYYSLKKNHETTGEI